MYILSHYRTPLVRHKSQGPPTHKGVNSTGNDQGGGPVLGSVHYKDEAEKCQKRNQSHF